MRTAEQEPRPTPAPDPARRRTAGLTILAVLAGLVALRDLWATLQYLGILPAALGPLAFYNRDLLAGRNLALAALAILGGSAFLAMLPDLLFTGACCSISCRRVCAAASARAERPARPARSCDVARAVSTSGITPGRLSRSRRVTPHGINHGDPIGS